MNSKHKPKRLTADERAWRADVAGVLFALVLTVCYMLVAHRLPVHWSIVLLITMALIKAFSFLLRWVANVPHDHDPYE
jgi:hypothetical protein